MKSGRELELIIEEIKKLKLPNAEIHSPFFVNDIDTGSKREIDVGILLKEKEIELFIAVEVRDRKGLQDITWVEQLISKKQSIGADLLIAVSSSSFTSSAIIKAHKHGVEIRATEGFSPTEIESWTEETFVELHTIQRKIRGIRLLTENNFHPKLPMQEHFFFLEDKKVKISFDELVSMLATPPLFLEIREKIPLHGDSIEFLVVFDVKNISILMDRKFKIIKSELHLIGAKKVKRLPLSSGLVYSDFSSLEKDAEYFSYSKKIQLIVDSKSKNAKWKIDFSHLVEEDEIFDNIVVKCKESVALTQLEIKYL